MNLPGVFMNRDLIILIIIHMYISSALPMTSEISKMEFLVYLSFHYCCYPSIVSHYMSSPFFLLSSIVFHIDFRCLFLTYFIQGIFSVYLQHHVSNDLIIFFSALGIVQFFYAILLFMSV